MFGQYEPFSVSNVYSRGLEATAATGGSCDATRSERSPSGIHVKKITLLLPSGVPAGLNWEDAGRRGDVEIRDTSVLISAVQRGGNVPAGR